MTEGGAGHLVLIVAISKGDLVFDNHQRRIVDWRKLPYQWVSQQSQPDAAVRMSIAMPQPVVTADSRLPREIGAAQATP